MARIRSVKPAFWSDEKVSPLPPIVRLVFLGLIGMADDAGRLLDNLKAIDAFIFPETDEYSAAESVDVLWALERIVRYVLPNGQRVIQVVNWKRHQKVDNPGKVVLPPADEGTILQPSREAIEALARVSRGSPPADVGGGRGKRDVGETPSSLRSEGGAAGAGDEARRPGGGAPPPVQDEGAPSLNALRGEAAVLVREQLWLQKEPPRRFGQDWGMDRELSIWNELVATEPPEDVNEVIRRLRTVGGFEVDEPLSLTLVYGRSAKSKTLWQSCLSAVRRGSTNGRGKKGGRVRVEVD